MNPEEIEALEELERPTPRSVTLDEIAIVGSPDGDDSELREAERADRARARGFDTVSDVAASIRRKGLPARADEAPTMIDTIGAAFLEPTAEARSPEMNRAASRVARTRRDATTAFGDGLTDLIEPLMPDSMEESGTAGSSGAVHGATLGAIDEIGGAGAELANIPDVVSGREDFGTAYRANRDRIRETGRRDREASPVAYGLGELAGAVATAPLLPGAGVPRTAGLASRLGGAAFEGAAYGGLAGGFSSDADTPDEMLADAGRGAVGGAAFGTAGHAIGEGAGRGYRALRGVADAADRLRVIAPAGGSAAGSDALLSLGPVDETAATMRRMGLGGVSTADDMAAAARRAREAAGGEIGDVRRVLDEAAPVPVDRIRGAMERHAGELGRTTSGAPLADAVRSRAERLPEVMGADAVPYSRAIDELQGLQGDVNWADRAGRPISASTGARRELARSVRRELDDVARPVLGDEGLEAYRGARNRFSVASAAGEAAEETAARNARNRLASPTDYLAMMGFGGMGGMSAGGATGGIGGAATGLAAAGLHRAYRLREPALRAASAETVRALLNSPGARALGTYAAPLARAARRGGEVFAATHAALMRSDPEYAATVEEAMSAPPPDVEAFDWAAFEEAPPTTDPTATEPFDWGAYEEETP